MGNYGLNDRFRILLVEDNRGDVDLILEALKPIAVEIDLFVAQDGEEAMKTLYAKPLHSLPDLVILDLNLPKKDGREVLAELKGNPQFKSIPVVVLTSSEAHDDIRNAYLLGTNCYITKPFSLDDFLDKILKVVQFWMKHATLPPREE